MQILWKGCAATFMSTTTVSHEMNSGKGYILVLKRLHWFEWIKRFLNFSTMFSQTSDKPNCDFVELMNQICGLEIN